MEKLKIGKFLVSTDVNGPGRRFVIWLQGCTFCCLGCFNPEFQSEAGGVFMEGEELINRIKSTPRIEGVTFTGGEPLLQARGLIPIAEWVKSWGLTIVCYTGYVYEEILSGKIPYAKDLINQVDILIDGLYMEDEKVPLLWRGSRNQKVYFLTERYKSMESLASREGYREIEILVSEEGITITGIFEMELWQKLKAKIQKTIKK